MIYYFLILNILSVVIPQSLIDNAILKIKTKIYLFKIESEVTAIRCIFSNITRKMKKEMNLRNSL